MIFVAINQRKYSMDSIMKSRDYLDLIALGATHEEAIEQILIFNF